MLPSRTRTTSYMPKWTIPSSFSIGKLLLTNVVVYEFNAHLAGKTRTFRKSNIYPPDATTEVSNAYNGRIVFAPPQTKFSQPFLIKLTRDTEWGILFPAVDRGRHRHNFART